jgi:bifunctional non-homologous end joining protein LigD
VSDYAHRIAKELEARHPDEVLSRMTKALRPGKVFLDWSQNNAAKTTVAPYSLRGREEPTVSTPLTWDEVEAGTPLRFWPADVLDRIASHGDLLEPLLARGPEVPA